MNYKLSNLTSLPLRRLRTKGVDHITMNEVCVIAKCAKPTLYRRLRDTDFPKPNKVPTTASCGPRYVNRWERKEVIKWLLEGNDPRWSKKSTNTVLSTTPDEPTDREKNVIRFKMAVIAIGLIGAIVYIKLW